MKMQYVKPSAELVRFENEDIITTSRGCGRDSLWDDCKIGSTIGWVDDHNCIEFFVNPYNLDD